jgi:hypothetical protein
MICIEPASTIYTFQNDVGVKNGVQRAVDHRGALDAPAVKGLSAGIPCCQRVCVCVCAYTHLGIIYTYTSRISRRGGRYTPIYVYNICIYYVYIYVADGRSFTVNARRRRRPRPRDRHSRLYIYIYI